ncbi:hypothetical protein [Novosphingobium sp.]|uniref:hypothetical protein n=1 Tax=Novosphingobium sp. TaxID=1874826 RepID=UPI002618EC5E|nr:hypothetical protein [Novosphingobium sp.]
MTRPGTLASLTLALALAACSQSQGQVVASSGPADGYPARLNLVGAEQPQEAAPRQPEGAQWLAAGERLSFGVPGQAPLLTLTCERDPSGASLIRLVRTTRAESGAKALLALIGNGRIARLPVNAMADGEAGRWEGLVPAVDPRLDVLKGINSVEATLPGGGTLQLKSSSEPRRLLEVCRARDLSRTAA